MKFLCICGIYNHRHEWQENLIQCMMDQVHQDWNLLFVDDRPKALTQGYHHDPRIYVQPVIGRYPTLMAKYDAALEMGNIIFPGYDAVCVLDDDDLYLPMHLAHHDTVLRNWDWSYPYAMYTTFPTVEAKPVKWGCNWASCAYTKSFLKTVGGFGNSAKMGFDQEHVRKCEEFSEPGQHNYLTYCYLWQQTLDDHTSQWSDGFNDTGWYAKTPCSVPTGTLEGKFSPLATPVLEKIKEQEALNGGIYKDIQAA